MTLHRPQPISSTLSYHALNQGSVEAIKTAILHEVLNRGPGTSVEIAHRLGITEYQASRRTSELLWSGLLARGNLINNPSGRKAYALYLTQEGLMQLP